jgi:ABC-type branched-subunit amino acid transport system ATPase component
VNQTADHLAAAPALSVIGVSKRYGPVVACDGVDLTVNRGEIHGLLGENGAGKTTLMKILLGLVQRDAGRIAVHGVTTEITSPQQAVTLGLGMVHQHFSLIEALTVWENISLGDTGRIDRAAICAQVDEVAARYRLPIDPTARVRALSPGQRQRVELIKCLRRNPSVLILDEPTSVLTPQEADEVLGQMKAMCRAQALTVTPNPAHTALARLEARLGDAFLLVTQNVDHLHEAAGSQRVVHMHGELFRSRCADETCDMAPFADRRHTFADLPRCLRARSRGGLYL